MKFPSVIEVAVRSSMQGVPNILVWLNTRLLGQDYYRAHVGLTNGAGIATLTASELRRAFQNDQSMFPMDYKVSLQDCDDEVVIGVEGGKAFRDHQRAALESGLVIESAKRSWRLAENGALRSTKTIIALPDGNPLNLTLHAENADDR